MATCKVRWMEPQNLQGELLHVEQHHHRDIFENSPANLGGILAQLYYNQLCGYIIQCCILLKSPFPSLKLCPH